MARIFLSHAKVDKLGAREIARLLKAAGHEVWIAEDEILVGESVPAAIARGLKDADFVLVCLSRAAIESGWVESEIDLAIMRQFGERAARVLPVRFDEVEPPDVIAHLRHVDAFPGEEALRSATDALLRTMTARAGSIAPASMPTSSKRRRDNLPPRRILVGRGRELSAIRDALLSGGACANAPVSVFGLGGVGKSALALEYAHRRRDDYPGGVWWLRADGSPINAMARIAADLRRVGPPFMQDVITREARSGFAVDVARAAQLALQTYEEPTLVVLDDIDAPGWKELLPHGNTHVLITTRDKRFCEGEIFHVDVLLHEEARLLAHLNAGASRGDEEDAALGRVLNELGGLAVAIEIAARAVKEWLGSWEAYDEHMRRGMERVLDDPDLVGDHGRGVFPTLDLSLNRLSAGSAAQRLLAGGVVFAPDAVPLEWAIAAADLEPHALETVKAQGVLKGLGLVSLDERGNNATFSIHRLVHRRARALYSERAKEWMDTQRRAVRHVAQWMMKMVDPKRLSAVEAQRKHVEEALRAADSSGSDIAYIEIADRLATHCQHRAQYAQAQDLFGEALNRVMKLEPPDPARESRELMNLGVMLCAVGTTEDLEVAHGLLRSSLSQAAEVHAASDIEMGRRHANVGVVELNLGEMDAAEENLMTAWSIFMQHHGESHPKTVAVVSALAMVQRARGRTDEARKMLESAIHAMSVHFGADHPYMSSPLANLAAVLHDLGDHEDACWALERALAIDVAVYGPEHPLVASLRRRIARAESLVFVSTGAEPQANPPTQRMNSEQATGEIPPVESNVAMYRVASTRLMVGVADKALAMGRADDAEQILSRMLQGVIKRTKAGNKMVKGGVAEYAALYAARLAGATTKGAWVDYVFELYLSLCLMLPMTVVDELYAAMPKVKDFDEGLVRTYVATARAHEIGPAERAILQRIEGLIALRRFDKATT